MLALSILLCVIGSFASYLVFIYIPGLRAECFVAAKVLFAQDKYITELMQQNLELLTIAKQQQALKNQYAQYLESEHFPSLTVPFPN